MPALSAAAATISAVGLAVAAALELPYAHHADATAAVSSHVPLHPLPGALSPAHVIAFYEDGDTTGTFRLRAAANHRDISRHLLDEKSRTAADPPVQRQLIKTKRKMMLLQSSILIIPRRLIFYFISL